MKKIILGILLIFWIGDYLYASELKIKSIKRIIKAKYILNQYEEILGKRANRKFYDNDDPKSKVVFLVKIEGEKGIAYKVCLYYKNSNSKFIQKKEVIVENSKGNNLIKFYFDRKNLEDGNKPNFWWVELVSEDGKILDEKGLKGYKKIKNKYKIIEKNK